MTAITELGHITLGVSNLAAWEGFAAAILGLEVMPGETADVRYLRMDYWHHRIKLVEDGSDDLQTIGLRLAGTLELMRRCDAVVVIPGWEHSTGTKAEIDEAMRLEIPVFIFGTEGWESSLVRMLNVAGVE